MYTELRSPIPVVVEEKGEGYAIAVLDYGPDWHLIFVVVLNDGGAIWCVPNPKLRVQANWTLGRTTA
jgi:hypothetical protein